MQSGEKAVIKKGQRVGISGKDCKGVIEFIGYPSFASGKWIGIVLDEPKGKNNGTVKGETYFKCAENHGMFVRQSQLILYDEAGAEIDLANTSMNTSTTSIADESQAVSRARSRLSSSRMSLSGAARMSQENLTNIPLPKKIETEGIKFKESLIPLPSSRQQSASFVETGFVGTLKPQFTPGQSMSPAATGGEERVSYQQLIQDNQSLKLQIKDLGERIETLKSKRLLDKEKLKDFEKMRIQLEQLIEFKTRVMESQASLQRELQRARQEARDAHAAREQYQDEMSDLAETVEMATLDKEMAEEKAETLQIELEQLKEKLEEQTLDLEILRTEIAQRVSEDGTGATHSSFEVKQLEQQNSRLRETLVRMRDLAAHEKHEYQKLLKDLDQKKSEISELGRTKEKLSQRVDEMERQIADLQEQVDAALGAEEMVEVLVERKMTLEEKVSELEEAVSDLEALQDMSDQLAESSKELEMELREELDMALAAARNAQRQRDAALETLMDREMTITKFRELTKKLQEQCIQLQTRLHSTESNRGSFKGSEQQLAEILDFQKTFAETRAQTKAVDLELRRLDAEEARSHVNYLLSFMPATFSNRGGDHDAILTLLFMPRMIQKTEILICQVQEKYKAVEKIDRHGILKDHDIAQSIFRYQLCAHMYALQTSLSSFEAALKVCSTDNLLQIGSAYPEMIFQEKAIDALIEHAKKDQIDENVSMEAIEKCCSYFFNIYENYFCNSNYVNQAKLVVNGTRFLGNVCDAASTEASIIKCFMSNPNEDVGILCTEIEATCSKIQQHLKASRRRVPRDVNPQSGNVNFGLEKEWFNRISTTYQHSVQLLKSLHLLSREIIQEVISRSDSQEATLPGNKIKEIAMIVIEKVYADSNLGPIPTLRTSLNILQKTTSDLSDKMTEYENDITINKTAKRQEDTKEVNPIHVRAQTTRKEMEEMKVLTRKLEEKDVDIKEAKIALRKKQEELSEMMLRKELAEKRASALQQENELTIDKLKRNLEEVTNQLKRKEKEFEETMDHLQTDIDSLESEKGQLKEKLKSIGKKTSQAEPTSYVSPSSSVSTHGASMSDNFLIDKILALKEALKHESHKKSMLLNRSLSKKLDSLKPLPRVESWQSDEKVQSLMQERRNILKEAHRKIIFLTVPDITKKKSLLISENPVFEKALPAYGLIERRRNLAKIKDRVNQLNEQVRNEIIKRKFGGIPETQFAVFPNKDLTAWMKKQPITAEVLIPHDGKSKSVNFLVGSEELRKLHTLISY